MANGMPPDPRITEMLTGGPDSPSPDPLHLSDPGMGVSAPVTQQQMPGAATPSIPTLDLPKPDKLATVLSAIGEATGIFGSPGRRELLVRYAREAGEASRKRHAASETQAITGLIMSALESGDPEHLSTVVKQLSGVKKLQPETVAALKEGQLRLAQHARQVQEDEQLAGALSKADPKMSALVEQIAKTSGTSKTAALKMINSGMLGQKPPPPKIEGGMVVQLPGTGIFDNGQGLQVTPLPGYAQKLSETGYSGLSNAAQEYIAAESARQGRAVADMMRDPKVMSEAESRGQAEREANRQIRQSALQLSFDRYGRPDTGTLRELRATRTMQRGVSDMLQKYESALRSHGGQMSPDLNIALNTAASAPEGFFGKSLAAIAQRYPRLTTADLEFVASYASMQQFARGAINDVGNLSNFERSVFTTMLGTPLDRPDLFRRRASTVLERASIAEDEVLLGMSTQGYRLPPTSTRSQPAETSSGGDDWTKKYTVKPQPSKQKPQY